MKKNFQSASPLFLLLFFAALVLTTRPVSGAQENPFKPANAERSPAWQGSAGVFVGVSKFSERSNLSPLRFAADDAIALANLFVNELPLLPPTNVWLALSPIPTNNTVLTKLRGQGVKIVSAEFTALRSVFEDAPAVASHPDGIYITSLATHGFEIRGQYCLMPSDGRSGSSAGTIAISELEQGLKNATARKSIIFVDACRETEFSTTRGDDKLPESFFKAFENAKGFGLLTACNIGQKSWEAPEFNHGVFTHFLLEGLRGKAGHDERTGYVRLIDLADYVTSETGKWVQQKKGVAQTPRFSGDTAANSIPMAVNPAELEASKAREQRASAALAAVTTLSFKYPNELTSENLSKLTTLLRTAPREELESLLKNSDTVLSFPEEKRAEPFRDFAAWFRGKYPSLIPVQPPAPSSATNKPAPPEPLPIARKPADETVVFIELAPQHPRSSVQFLQHGRPQFISGVSEAIRGLNVNVMTQRGRSIDYILRLTIVDYDAPIPPKASPNKNSRQFTISLNDIFKGKNLPKESMSCLWNLYRTDKVEVANGTAKGEIKISDYPSSESASALAAEIGKAIASQVGPSLKK